MCLCAVCDGVSEMYCDSGECVPLSYICDGDNDCRDASDERNCHSNTPSAGTSITLSPSDSHMHSGVVSIFSPSM